MLNAFRTLISAAYRDHSPRQPSRPPDDMIIYAIGDIHGELSLLASLLDKITCDFAEHGHGHLPVIVYIGDYVDRGPDSAGVIDFLLANPLPEFRQNWVLGNHDAAMLDFLRDPVKGAAWLEIGGYATLRSYGVQPNFSGSPADRLRFLRDSLAEHLPSEHLTFLTALEKIIIYGDYAFVHAGIRPGRLLSEQAIDDLLWIRSPFLEATRLHEKCIVHGHTIVPQIELKPNRIAIDTGAFSTGILSAIVLQGPHMRQLQARKDAISSQFQTLARFCHRVA